MALVSKKDAASTPPRRERAGGGKGPRVGSEKLEAEPLPAVFLEPMKAEGVTAIPEGDWHLEIKFDGYRALAVVAQRKVELWSRNRNLLNAGFPEVAEAVAKLRCKSAIIDGEIVALDTAGRPRFQLLQGRSKSAERAPLVYYVFDLLQLDGKSLLNLPIEARQWALGRLLGDGKSGLVRQSPVFEVDPLALLAEMREKGLEGIVAKRGGSLYEPGLRTGAWLKCKINAEQEFVIGGFTPPQNSRPYFGAIVVGYYEAGKFLYAGKVGTGFNRAKLAALHGQFMARKRPSCPFENLPLPKGSRFGVGMTSAVMKSVTWVQPELVCQVRFSEWTDDGLLRQPVFLALRDDKPAHEVRREAGGAA